MSYLLKCCCFAHRRQSKEIIDPLPETAGYGAKFPSYQVLPTDDVQKPQSVRGRSVSIKDHQEGTTEPLTSTSEKAVSNASLSRFPTPDHTSKAARMPTTRESQRLKPHQRTTSLTRTPQAFNHPDK